MAQVPPLLGLSPSRQILGRFPSLSHHRPQKGESDTTTSEKASFSSCSFFFFIFRSGICLLQLHLHTVGLKACCVSLTDRKKKRTHFKRRAFRCRSTPCSPSPTQIPHPRFSAGPFHDKTCKVPEIANARPERPNPIQSHDSWLIVILLASWWGFLEGTRVCDLATWSNSWSWSARVRPRSNRSRIAKGPNHPSPRRTVDLLWNSTVPDQCTPTSLSVHL